MIVPRSVSLWIIVSKFHAVIYTASKRSKGQYLQQKYIFINLIRTHVIVGMCTYVRGVRIGDVSVLKIPVNVDRHLSILILVLTKKYTCLKLMLDI